MTPLSGILPHSRNTQLAPTHQLGYISNWLTTLLMPNIADAMGLMGLQAKKLGEALRMQ